MGLGPIELLFIKFPGSQFNGKILPALEDVVSRDIVSIVDCLLVMKTPDGDIEIVEVEDLGGSEDVQKLKNFVSETNGLIGEEDIEEFAWALEPGDSAAALVFEHTWAKPFQDALVASGAELVGDIRIPGAVGDEVLAAVNE